MALPVLHVLWWLVALLLFSACPSTTADEEDIAIYDGWLFGEVFTPNPLATRAQFGKTSGRWQAEGEDQACTIRRDGKRFFLADMNTQLHGEEEEGTGVIRGKTLMDNGAGKFSEEGTFIFTPASCKTNVPVISVDWRKSHVRYTGWIKSQAFEDDFKPHDIKVQLEDSVGRWQVDGEDVKIRVEWDGDNVSIVDTDDTMLKGSVEASGVIRGTIIQITDSDEPIGTFVLTQEGGMMGPPTVQLLCGEDPGMAAARIATDRRTGFTSAAKAVQLARLFANALETDALSYEPPAQLDIGTPRNRPRLLKTGGQYIKRAADDYKYQRYQDGMADLVRALLRPGLDETAEDRLTAKLQEGLTKALRRRRELAHAGDLEALLNDLDISEAGADNGELDQKTVRRKYRELSLKYHPDKNPWAKELFNSIRDAYEILSDPVKTLLYDTGGAELANKYDTQKRRNIPVVELMEIKLQVTLEDIYTGAVKTSFYGRRVVCRMCRIHPELPRCSECSPCPPEREIKFRRGFRQWVDIPSNDKCMYQTHPLEVTVEKGMNTKHVIRHPHMGNQLPKKIPGDLAVRLEVKPHRIFFNFRGADLRATLTITLHEALLGFERKLVHLDGHTVRIESKRGQIVKPGDTRTIRNEGMPSTISQGRFGNLVVTFEVEFPMVLPNRVHKHLETAFEVWGLGPAPVLDVNQEEEAEEVDEQQDADDWHDPDSENYKDFDDGQKYKEEL